MRFERLFSANVAAVRAYARRRVDPVAADDAVSEVFVIAWRRLDDVPEDALPWLLGCARRVLAHQRRRVGRDAALVERLAMSARVAPTITVSDDAVLGRALAQLRDRDRELLLLIAWEGLEPAQAAEVLGCSRSAVDTRLHRARKRLAEALAQAERGAHQDAKRRPVKEL
jgi:RNA polymerase sigma-70 factor, ECF subfamily